jgi:nucleoside phosphorylase
MRADLTYCDFLILAPLQLEIESLERALLEAGWTISNVATSEFPRIIEAKISDSTEAYSEHRHVAIVQLTYQGVLHASVDTARALELYEPGYVVSFGIAGTFNSSDAPIGAAVFATELFYYEPSKEKSNNTQSRMDPVNVGDTLFNRYRNVDVPNIIKAFGPIASGEKLFADIASEDREPIPSGTENFGEVGVRRATTRERIIATNDKILAVEMEAAGVGRAVKRLLPSAEFLAIKGISDLADENKNRIGQEEQTRNRRTAASNAARCLIELMRNSPLRRFLRGMPTAYEATLEDKAMQEAKRICDILDPFGITTNYVHLFACLLGRRGPIPAYFHWDQSTAALHWIDFKILTALRALPKEIVSPTPLVTIGEDVRLDQSWYSSVNQLVGVPPRTERQVRAQLEKFPFSNRFGFTHQAEEQIRSELERLRFADRPEITLNLMRYMLGQFCHRRMFVFTWKMYRAKWEQLTESVGTWFSIFEWDTLTLGGELGKQEPPGQDLLIEPRSYASLNKWLSTSPPVAVVQEFVNHFECHRDLFCPAPSSSQLDPTVGLRALTACWDKVFFV